MPSKRVFFFLRSNLPSKPTINAKWWTSCAHGTKKSCCSRFFMIVLPVFFFFSFFATSRWSLFTARFFSSLFVFVPFHSMRHNPPSVISKNLKGTIFFSSSNMLPSHWNDIARRKKKFLSVEVNTLIGFWVMVQLQEVFGARISGGNVFQMLGKLFSALGTFMKLIGENLCKEVFKKIDEIERKKKL